MGTGVAASIVFYISYHFQSPSNGSAASCRDVGCREEDAESVKDETQRLGFRFKSVFVGKSVEVMFRSATQLPAISAALIPPSS
jgi:hypothetical protein